MEIINKHKNVLEKAKIIVNHQKQLTKAKGELFNIYNILNLKTKEVRTHSAFIAELLNPKGNHLMGNVFLKNFISLLDKSISFNPEKATIFIEYFIGKRDDELKKGGRIDILLKDSVGNIISIENKIDAKDQNKQIERYHSYKEIGRNTVVYLSKFGDEPSPESKGDLVSGKDYYIISYQNEIIKWLEACQKLASDQPILRESIKQYKILIQQITHTLENKQDIELSKIVLDNLEEASYISSKYDQVVNNIRNNFRNKIIKKLKSDIENHPTLKAYKISTKKDASNKYSSLWLNHPSSSSKKIWFGVESFSGTGHLEGDLFVGIFCENLTIGDEYISIPSANKWQHYKLLTHNDEKLNLANNNFLKELNNKTTIEIISKDVSNQIISFIESHNDIIEN